MGKFCLQPSRLVKRWCKSRVLRLPSTGRASPSLSQHCTNYMTSCFDCAVTYALPVVCVVSLVSLMSWQGLTRLIPASGSLVLRTDHSDINNINNNFLRAEFKSSRTNPDGSVEYTFIVPKESGSSPSSSDVSSEPHPTGSIRSNHISASGSANSGGNGSRITSPPPAHNGKDGTAAEKNAEGVGGSRGADGGVVSSRISLPYPLTLNSDYVINPVNLCPPGERVDYLIIVHSATAYLERRVAIRETFGARGLFANVTQRVAFMLGMTSDPAATRKIQQEALHYGDVVQGQFVDSYHNLTHKGVMALRWTADFCHQARLIVKIDDDTFVNPFRLVQTALPDFASRQRSIVCHVRRAGVSPIQRTKGKWKVHADVFPAMTHYPVDHCMGYFVILTPDLVRPLLRAAHINPFFWIDDIYLFGILPATVGSVNFVNIKTNLTLRFKSGMECVNQYGLGCQFLGVSHYTQAGFDSLWYGLVSNVSVDLSRQFRLFEGS